MELRELRYSSDDWCETHSSLFTLLMLTSCMCH